MSKNKRINNIQSSNKKFKKNDDIDVANSLLQLYNTHNYQATTKLNINQIVYKLIDFKKKYSFILGYINQKTLILTKITKLEIQIIQINIIDNINFINIIFVPRTFSEPTYQVINYLLTEFNVPREYGNFEFCEVSIYIKYIFSLIKSTVTNINIDLDTVYIDIINIINLKKKSTYFRKFSYR